MRISPRLTLDGALFGDFLFLKLYIMVDIKQLKIYIYSVIKIKVFWVLRVWVHLLEIILNRFWELHLLLLGIFFLV